MEALLAGQMNAARERDTTYKNTVNHDGCEGRGSRTEACPQACGFAPRRFLPRQTYRHTCLVIRPNCPEPGDLWLSSQGFSGRH
jgi:hypothetical protein